MNLAHTETLGPYAADSWADMTGSVTGPGTYVFIAAVTLADADTLQAQVTLSDGTIFAVVEDVTVIADDLAASSRQTGFQSAPVPLVDNTWEAFVRLKHSAATDQAFEVRVLKL